MIGVLLDADLAILGSSPTTYDAYVAAVRAEYADVGDDEWRAGRTGVLEGFGNREILFVTAAGSGTCLAVIANRDADLGHVAYEMAILVRRTGEHIRVGLRAPAGNGWS